MRHGVGLGMGLMLLGLVFSAPAFAWCWNSSECPNGDTCQWTWNFIFPVRECRFTLCNADSECRNNTLCILGTCQEGCREDGDCASGRCVNARCETPTVTPGGGVPGEGRKCMPADGSKPANWATDRNGKPLGACPRGTYCASTGFCRKLES